MPDLNSPSTPQQRLEKSRALFPHTALGKIFLNHAATAPMSSRVTSAMMNHLVERSAGKLDTYLLSDLPMVARCREGIARLIHAESADRIALLGNTSEGLNCVASGFPWKSGDRILLHEGEFPANVYPYLNVRELGVEVDFAPQINGGISIESITASIKPNTKLISISAVQFLTGFRANIAEIGSYCCDKGIVFVVDGIQAVGAITIDVQKMKIDALAAGGQKWQMSPQGTGFLYLSEELQNRLRVQNLGWLGVEDPWNFSDFDQPLSPSMRRFEGGTRNIPGIWGMEAAISTLLEFGMETIEQSIASLAHHLMMGMQAIDGVEILTPTNSSERAGIVTIRPPANADAKSIFKALLADEITVSLREGNIRFAPHFYNSLTEIAVAVSATRTAILSFSKNHRS